MGAYVNPETTSKEAWLEENCEHDKGVTRPPTMEELGGWLDAGLYPVCLVLNGPFTAAGIVFDARELEAFTDRSDPRPKRWYFVDLEKLKGVSNIEQYLR